MAALATCIKRAGKALRDEDREAINARFVELTLAGTSAKEAARMAVAEQIAAVEGMLAAKPDGAQAATDTTQAQRDEAQVHAKELGGQVVWQSGDLALIRGYAILSGAPVYVVAKDTSRSKVDVEAYTGNVITPEQKAQLVQIKRDLEAADAAAHEARPFVQFKDGVAMSANVPDGIAGVAAGWRKMLGLTANVYFTTIADARADAGKFTGPHRVIGSAGLDDNEAGSMRRTPNGDYYIAFVSGTSKTKMLEVLAHELGHLHQREAFEKADQATQDAIRAEHAKWLESQTGKTARELVESLRGRATARDVRGRDGMMASELTPYWRSFGEWYADQVSRWAVSSEKPVGVVAQFFGRLAAALKSFYASVRGQGYLPNQTFAAYLDAMAQEPERVGVVAEPEAESAAPEAKPEVAPMPAVGGISMSLAQQAHAGTSHVPERRAEQERDSFMGALRDAWERAARIAGTDPAAIERISEVFADVADGYRARYTATLTARSRVMSSMITGAARFPVERNRKRMETERKRAEEASEYLARGIKRLIRAARGPIDNSPESELERVRLNLTQREELQETMKAANAALRKDDDAALEDLGFTAEQIADLKKGSKWERGFPAYRLTNNNAEIRRLRERLESAEARMKDAAAGPVETERQGVRIVEDATDDRLRLIFDGKPSEAVRDDLKANGFKWSPKNDAWQRQLTDNARYAAKVVLDKHYPEGDDAGNVSMFSRAASGRNGVPMPDAEALAEIVRKANPTGPRIILHDDVRKAPKDLLDAIRQEGAENDVEGAYHQGEIHIFPGNIASPDRLLFVMGKHEIRHAGFDAMLGKRKNSVLMGIALSNKAVAEAARQKMKDGHASSMVQGVEEALADMPVEELQALQGNSWKRLVAAVRQWLRDLAKRIERAYPNLAAKIRPDEWTDADVAAMVRRAEDVSRRGSGVFGGGDTAFARAWHGTPHRGIERFSTDYIGSGEGAQAYGWGLYFASKREVAEHYRKALTRDVFLDGAPMRNKSLAGPEDMMTNMFRNRKAAGLDDETARSQTAQWAKDNRQIAGMRTPEQIDAFVARLETQKGQVYEVNVPEDDELLMWDKPISEQSAKVRAALNTSRWQELAFRKDGEPRNLKGEDLYRTIGKELQTATDDMASADGAPRGWGSVAQTINDRSSNDRAASQALAALGIKGIKYLDGSSRTKSLRDIKREFLAELPQDADFDEVMGLIGEGTFSPANESILKALAADDWLGFDYPSQAISAALGGRLQDFDASPALLKAVADAQDDGSHNYVIFSGDDVQIQRTMFSRRKPNHTPADAALQPGDVLGSDTEGQARIAKGYKARAKAVLARMDHVINGLGGLPDSDQFMAQRYLALGKIAAVDEAAAMIRKVFGKATADDKKAIYAYLTTAGATADAVQSPEVREAATQVKQYIGDVGDMLVDRGLLSEESREEYRDRYLPRLYLSHMLDEGDWRAIGTGKKVSDMGYLKARKEIPQEIRDVILGEVKDPTYLAATAIAKPMRDIALLDWLEQISGNDAWIFPASLALWQGKKVSVYWLKAEADALRTRARLYPEEVNREKATAIADQMDALAERTLGEANRNHKDYKRMPNTQRYGRLRGMLVREEIYNDIMGSQVFDSGDKGWAESILGYGGLGSKMTSLWKASKVSLNIPGQIRNVISNGVLLQLSGVPLHKFPVYIARFVRQYRHGGKHWGIAKKYGVTESTFQAHELFRAKRDLIELEKTIGGMTPLLALKSVGAAIMDVTGDAYQFAEAMFKTMKIMDAMEREGKTEAEAALEAQKWLFDYSLLDKNIRYLRNAPVGAPFLTFTTKILPRLAEVAALHPQRFLPWVGLYFGMQFLAQAEFGGDDEDWKRLKKALPEWMHSKPHVAFLPFRDDAGRLQALDLSYFFPWSQWMEFGANLAQGELGAAMKNMGIFGGPVTDLITALKTGKDAFTGRDIVNEGDPTSAQAAAITAYLWDMAMPPMIGSHGVVSPLWLLGPEYGGKVAQAATGSTNRYGDPRATMGQAAARMVGVNVYGVDPNVTQAINIAQLQADVAKTQARLRSLMSDKSLTPEQRKELSEKYGAERLERQQKLNKYMSESRVPAFAKRQKEPATQ